jgi:hypothetical protein
MRKIKSNRMDVIEKGASLKFDFKKIFHFRTKLERRADIECRYLEVIKNSLMEYFGLDEVDALTTGLDLLDDLKEGGLI